MNKENIINFKPRFIMCNAPNFRDGSKNDILINILLIQQLESCTGMWPTQNKEKISVVDGSIITMGHNNCYIVYDSVKDVLEKIENETIIHSASALSNSPIN